MVKEQGGLSIAVYPPKTKDARKNANNYIKDGRVHAIAPADYSPDSKLDCVIKAYIDLVAARSALTASFGKEEKRDKKQL